METGSSGGGGGRGPGDDFHGLKFGKKIYFEQDVDGGSGSSSASGGMEGQGPAGPAGGGGGAGASTAATAGGGSNASQPRCQVEGCGVDLSGGKTYYCRHKVCSMHSKAPLVVVAGIEQRFCQQCSRFHQLPEFDQGKRSCRRRLAGHNERRRKLPTGPMSTRYGRLAASFNDPGRLRSFLLDFSYPRAPAGVADPWPAVHPGDHRMPGTTQWHGGHHEQHHAHRSAVTGYGDHHAYDGQGSSSSGGGGAPMIPAGFQLPSDECMADSSCALSLLSTQPWDSSAHSASHNRSLAMSTTSAFQGSPVAPSVMASNYMAAAAASSSGSWGSPRSGRSMQQQHHHHHHMPHDAVMSDVHPSSVHHGQFGELELALQQGRAAPNPPHAEHGSGGAFGPSGNSMNWSL